MIQLLISFFTALPELLKLVKAIQQEINKAEVDRKVKDDVRQIKEAFNEKDPNKLNAIFKSNNDSK